MRRFLLDTHVALWALADPDRLTQVERQAIVDPLNLVCVSAVSVWEVEIKRALGELAAPDHFAAECTNRGFAALPIGFGHAECAGRLPPHHSDPFDRMLIAQAIEDDLKLVTRDQAFAAYDVVLL